MKKRIFALLTALAVCLSLTACGGDKKTESTDSSAESSVSETTSKESSGEQGNTHGGRLPSSKEDPKESSAPEETKEPAAPNSSLHNGGTPEEIIQNEPYLIAGIAYLGTVSGPMLSVGESVISQTGYAPFLANIPYERQVSSADGTEQLVWGVLPVDPTSTVSVNDENGEVLYRSESGEPILLFTDIADETEIVVVGGNGDATFYTMLNGTGEYPELPNSGTVFDFTPHLGENRPAEDWQLQAKWQFMPSGNAFSYERPGITNVELWLRPGGNAVMIDWAEQEIFAMYEGSWTRTSDSTVKIEMLATVAAPPLPGKISGEYQFELQTGNMLVLTAQEGSDPLAGEPSGMEFYTMGGYYDESRDFSADPFAQEACKKVLNFHENQYQVKHEHAAVDSITQEGYLIQLYNGTDRDRKDSEWYILGAGASEGRSLIWNNWINFDTGTFLDNYPGGLSDDGRGPDENPGGLSDDGRGPDENPGGLSDDGRDPTEIAEENACRIISNFYRDNNDGFLPGTVMVDSWEEDGLLVHLYDDMDTHTATYGWYLINLETLQGYDWMTNEAIDFSAYDY